MVLRPWRYLLILSSQFSPLYPGSNHSCGRCSAEQENKSPSLLARRPRKGPLGAGMSWEDCREEGTQQSEPIILCMNSWVLFQNSIYASDSKQHAKGYTTAQVLCWLLHNMHETHQNGTARTLKTKLTLEPQPREIG